MDHIVAECIKAMAHKLSVEQGADIRRVGEVTQITHPHELHHSWPREFSYRIEFMAAGDFAHVRQAVTAALGGERAEHVLSLFTDDRPATFQAATRGGYQHAWSNVLMGFQLQEERDSAFLAEHADVKEIRTIEDVEALNALAPDSSTRPASLADPFLHNFVAIENGRISAKAQVVTLPGGVAYVTEMFTIPAARRHGLGRNLLEHVHHTAWNNGARMVVLIPSLMTREILFFDRFGYIELIPMLVLAPAAPPALPET